MGIRTVYICDITGYESEDPSDFVFFTVERDGTQSNVRVSEASLKEAMEEEEFLSQIVIRDDDDGN